MSTEEERRRKKIIADSQVAAAASRGIFMLQRDELTQAQVDAWLELDENYLRQLERIFPEALR